MLPIVSNWRGSYRLPFIYVTAEETANPEMKKKVQGRSWQKKDE